MNRIYSTIQNLTTTAPIDIDKSILVQHFARELGWTPSYNLYPSNEADIVSMHLIVEHGLENSAILSFLKTPYNSLNDIQRNGLLNISYNNLVDWHIHIDKEKITYVYNRNISSNNLIQESSFRNDQFDSLRSEAFEQIIGKRQSPNIPALDDALINTISYWKRNISAELNNTVSNESLSSFFNSIMFVRALEDNMKRYKQLDNTDKVLIEAWKSYEGVDSFTGVLTVAQKILNKKKIPTYLLDKKELEIFNSLDRQSLIFLFEDFYKNRVASFYNYDFSIMSKHALSRIYEKYVAILKVEETSQLALFPKMPEEETNKAFGAIYTPQYIARFFARYLKHNLPPTLFNKIKVAEPAVGSGIFLRSLLEIKCDPRLEENTNEKIKQSFQDILGIDVDDNACKASKLSLALLQLVLTDEFPPKLTIIKAEAISYLKKNPKLKNSYDAVISNPPFISTEVLSKEFKEIIIDFLGDLNHGRPDSYIAFLKGGIDLIKPGGYGLYVLPHSFLMSDSTSKLRKFLSDNCWITCVADLSAIPVFGNTGIYVILLIFQKKVASNISNPKSTIIKCNDFVGRALQDGLQNKFVENPFYSVFEIEQSFFKNETWSIMPLGELNLKDKLSLFPKLNTFVEIRQGFVTGADDIFIINKTSIPYGEEEIYIPYLPDKQIDRYSKNKSGSQYLFYPFINNKKLEEKDLKTNYPETWKYLLSKKKLLVAKKSFADAKEWWRPLRTRQPEHMLVPKIITPHLSIMPKFTVDLDGKFGVSRSPFLIPKVSGSGEKELLLYFLGILNSTPCYWYISNHSHKYSQGYTMIEVKTLQHTPVPDPSQIPIKVFKNIVELVSNRLKSNAIEGIMIEKEIDEIVCNLYNLTPEDRNVFGI